LEFNIPFQHKYGYITDERSGVKSYPYPVKKVSDTLTSTLAAFLFSSHPKTERDREAQLNYYASTYNGEATTTPQDKTKSTTRSTTVLQPFVRDYPGEPVPEVTPTHHPDHHPIFISFFHLPRSIASSLFKVI